MAPRVALALPLLVGNVAAHGSLFYPPPRQSFDRHVSVFWQSRRILAPARAPWCNSANSVTRLPLQLPQGGGRAPLSSCNCGDAKAGCDEGIRDVAAGSRAWFSRGC